jgi:hypothetical protein
MENTKAHCSLLLSHPSSEKWKVKNEKWKIKMKNKNENDKWKMKYEKWKMKNEKWKMKNSTEHYTVLQADKKAILWDEH